MHNDEVKKRSKQDLMPVAPEHAFDLEVVDFSDLERIEEAIAPVLTMVKPAEAAAAAGPGAPATHRMNAV
jgi:hypothetical protein